MKRISVDITRKHRIQPHRRMNWVIITKRIIRSQPDGRQTTRGKGSLPPGQMNIERACQHGRRRVDGKLNRSNLDGSSAKLGLE